MIQCVTPYFKGNSRKYSHASIVCFTTSSFTLRSPDSAPTDYHLFFFLTKFSEWKIFKSREQVIQAVEEIFESKTTAFDMDGIHKLLKKMGEGHK